MSRGSVFGAIVASVVIMAAISFIIVPMFPASGTIIQTSYMETSSYAVINDGDTTLTAVPDTALNITTRGNTKIHARFNAIVYQYIDGPSVSVDFWRFNISVVVAATSGQITNRTVIFGYSGAISGNYQEFYCNSLNIEFTTTILPAAQYAISVWWVSLTDTTLQSQLHFSTEFYNRTRSLQLEEIVP